MRTCTESEESQAVIELFQLHLFSKKEIQSAYKDTQGKSGQHKLKLAKQGRAESGAKNKGRSAYHKSLCSQEGWAPALALSFPAANRKGETLSLHNSQCPGDKNKLIAQKGNCS